MEMNLFERILARFRAPPVPPELPATFAVTLEEGGRWHEFPAGAPGRIHSILFEDGSTWDAVNGWRGERFRRLESWIVRRDGSMEWWRAKGTPNAGFRQ